MNPTYEVGDVVQIISKEEVLSNPTDNFGNFIFVFGGGCRTSIDIRSAFHDCLCKGVTARISATTAVCARQMFSHLSDTFVFVYGKFLAEHRQNESEYRRQNEQYQ